ncbi:hypothetical protein ACSBR2_033089 [Camellia fascicularis]
MPCLLYCYPIDSSKDCLFLAELQVVLGNIDTTYNVHWVLCTPVVSIFNRSRTSATSYRCSFYCRTLNSAMDSKDHSAGY